ncbi:MAG: stage II sporulation protein R [Bacillota bacterium]|nr:stage II sporulation protein R [Bacillota bacterium]
MRTRIIVSGLLLTTFLALVALLNQAFSGLSGARVAYRPDNLIRLHIVANSDAPSDQALKLRVRDRILAEAAAELQGVTSREEARRILAERLPTLILAAQEEVKAAGYDYPVRGELGSFSFPLRRYGEVVLPAGRYEALRLVIGRGTGSNWWCVLFPPLCFLNVDGPEARRVQVRLVEKGQPEGGSEKEGRRLILSWKGWSDLAGPGLGLTTTAWPWWAGKMALQQK